MFGANRGLSRLLTLIALTCCATDVALTQDAAAKPRGRRMAIIIGINGYEHFPKLRFCRADARHLATNLEQQCGYSAENIVLLVDEGEYTNLPMRRTILDRTRSFAEQAQPDDTLLFYFSGHGVLIDDAGYLVPVDADAEAAEKLVSIAEIRALLRESRARQRVMIIDACHSGAERALKRPMERGFEKALESDAEGIITLASCRANETSLEIEDAEHGLFTFWLVEGMRGKADQECAGNKDGKVEVTELYQYVHQQVSAAATSQHGHTQTPALLATVSGQIVIAIIVVTPPAPPPPTPTPTPAPAPAPPAPARPQPKVERIGNILRITTCGVGAGEMAQLQDARQKMYDAYANYVRTQLKSGQDAESLRRYARDRGGNPTEATQREDCGCLELVHEVPLP